MYLGRRENHDTNQAGLHNNYPEFWNRLFPRVNALNNSVKSNLSHNSNYLQQSKMFPLAPLVSPHPSLHHDSVRFLIVGSSFLVFVSKVLFMYAYTRYSFNFLIFKMATVWNYWLANRVSPPWFKSCIFQQIWREACLSHTLGKLWTFSQLNCHEIRASKNHFLAMMQLQEDLYDSWIWNL